MKSEKLKDRSGFKRISELIPSALGSLRSDYRNGLVKRGLTDNEIEEKMKEWDFHFKEFQTP